MTVHESAPALSTPGASGGDGPIDQDRALKARHRAMWASGDFPTVAADLVNGIGPVVVAECRVKPGDAVLDVAAGAGNAAIPAALTGADVVATDLTPELFVAGRAAAERVGATLEWRTADAEALPFPDASFDVVLSTFGVMFAPHHQIAADELARVCRPGARVALANWTPPGFLGQLVGTLRPFVPPPPPGAQPPPLWGTPAHLAELFGDRIVWAVRRRTVRVERFPGPTDFRVYFAEKFGPVIAAYRNVGDDADRRAELDAALDALAARFTTDGVMEWEYLLATGIRS